MEWKGGEKWRGEYKTGRGERRVEGRIGGVERRGGKLARAFCPRDVFAASVG